ncbi:MAG: hypothetical protein AAB575_01535 [Patescibacteria group bacterium]
MKLKLYKTPLERYQEKQRKKLEKHLGIKPHASGGHTFKRPVNKPKEKDSR